MSAFISVWTELKMNHMDKSKVRDERRNIRTEKAVRASGFMRLSECHVTQQDESHKSITVWRIQVDSCYWSFILYALLTYRISTLIFLYSNFFCIFVKTAFCQSNMQEILILFLKVGLAHITCALLNQTRLKWMYLFCILVEIFSFSLKSSL